MDTKATAAEMTRKGAEFLKTHEWAQGFYAYDQYGAKVDPTRPTATCFCALGAIAAANAPENLSKWDYQYRAADEVAHALYELTDEGLYKTPDEYGIAGFNDAEGRTKEEVIDFLNDLAAAFEANGL
jgi:hypothetical protein